MDAERPSQVPFSLVVPTIYGQVIVNRHDINQTNALFKTGRSIDHAEILLLSQILAGLGANLTFIDVGANFGTFSLALAPRVGPAGRVHAFEPQRILFNMLAGTIALNSVTNVHCHHLAVGDREGEIEVPQFDYHRPLNFGSVEFGPRQREPLSQERGNDPARLETVGLTTLDRFAFPRVDLIKIDAEGMEHQVLSGAALTIERCRPVLFVEHTKAGTEALRHRLQCLTYQVHECGPNFLGIPGELASRMTVRGR
ncbi:MAG: FkbM family methyltransferase [Rhodospirillaceae bacterium]